MKRILGIIGGALLICAVLMAVIVGAIFFFTQDIAVAGDAFMQTVKEERFEEAYAMLGDSAVAQGDLEEFSSTFAGLTSWNFNSRSIENNVGYLSGTATFGEDTYYLSLDFEKVGETWLITQISFDEADSTED